MKKLWTTCAALLLLVAGCSGGSKIMPGAAGSDRSATSTVPVSFSIRVPAAPASGSRTPRYISPGTQSTAVFGYQGTRNIIASYANCTLRACTNSFSVPPGLTHFDVVLYGGPGQSGGTLSSGSADVVIAAGQANNVNITFGGVPASIALNAAATLLSPGQSTTVTVSAKDASGFTIIGPGNFANPIALTANDPTISVSPTTILAPGQNATITYVGGSAIPVVTVGATAQGISQSAVSPVAISVATAPISLSPNWVSAGPRFSGASGKLQAFAIDLAHRNTMYVGGGWGTGGEVLTDAGVYRTRDGGATWVPIVNGLTDTIVNSLWLDQNNPSTLVAATQLSGIFRSTDGGDTWTNVYSASNATQLLFDAASGSLFATNSAGVIQSTDGGGTWRTIVSLPNPANALGMAGGVMYAGCTDGSIWSNTGGSWHLSATLPSTTLGSATVHQIVVDPLSPGTLFVSSVGIYGGIYTEGLSASTDFGVTFHTVTLPSDIRGAQVMAMSVVTPHKLYVNGVAGYATTDNGTTFTPTGDNGDSRLMTVVPGIVANTEAFYLASDQGLATSSDGLHYKVLTANLSVGYSTDVAVAGSTIVAPLQDFSPAVSNDGGATWSSPAGSFYEDGQVVFNPGNPSYCYMLDPWAGYGYNVSSDGCHTFTHEPSIEAAGYGGDSIAVDASHPNVVYVGTNAGLRKSADYGITFNTVTSPLTSISDVAVAGSDSNTIVISGSAGSSCCGPYVTHDGGSTWTRGTLSGAPLPAFNTFALAVDPQNANIIVAGSLDYNGVGVFRSSDGGATYVHLTDPIGSLSKWRSVKDLFAETNPPIAPAFNANKFYFPYATRLRFNPAAAGTPMLALGTTMGALVSSDFGDHWTNVTGNAISKTVNGLQWSNGFLYLATQGQGILRSTTRLQSQERRVQSR